MKNLIKILIMMIFPFIMSCNIGIEHTEFIDGDIIFHTSKSSQSKMIQKITKSKMSHVGMIFEKNDKLYVIEAVQPVKITPLQSFIKRGVDSKYVVMRPKFKISDSDFKKMYKYGKRQVGKNYDIKFGWSDSRMYCSELVWKIYYEGTGKKLSRVKKFKNYNLTSPLVMKEIKKRFGKSFNPNEKVVTPKDLYKSNKLRIVYSNF